MLYRKSLKRLQNTIEGRGVVGGGDNIEMKVLDQRLCSYYCLSGSENGTLCIEEDEYKTDSISPIYEGGRYPAFHTESCYANPDTPNL